MASRREPRRFNGAQRIALYLAADGHCEECGTELERGWHGDHVTPYSAGGPTDVVNGQALCPTCNLKKGNRHMQLRPWQEEALAKFLNNTSNFLAVATPGAGKTTFALAAAQALIDRGEISRIIVVVPTAHLRKQWAGAAARLGVQLDYEYANGIGSIAKDYDGTVVTYATVASQPLLWRRLATQLPTLVILDEVHHAGDAEHLSWGRSLPEAFDPAARRLLLSGTPFRSDRQRIPFVAYDGTECAPSYNYDYGMALEDGTVVRPMSFPVLDGDMQWRAASVLSSARLSDATEEDRARALTAAYDSDGDWIASALRHADQDLTYARDDMPDAAGLVVASSQAHARKYAELLRQITGEPAVVAVSDDPEASKAIERFGNATSRWIVAVNMVAEGVDIPRLAVGVYASRYATEMFFRQVVGRFVRMRSDGDITTGRLFIPSLDNLVKYARDIERTVDKVIMEEESKARRAVNDEDADRPPQSFVDVVPMGSSEATIAQTIFRSDALTADELDRAKRYCEAAGIRSMSVEEAARLLRFAGMQQPTREPEQPRQTTQAAPAVTLTEQKNRLRRRIRDLVNHYARNAGIEHKMVHAKLNKLVQEKSINAATVQSLERRITILTGWIAVA